MASRKVKDWLERPEAATESAVAVETLPQPPEATEAVTDEPDTQSAELVQACQAASTALEALEDWHRRVETNCKASWRLHAPSSKRHWKITVRSRKHG
jgi:hypothetical protein